MINLLVTKEEIELLKSSLVTVQNSIDRDDLEDFTSNKDYCVIIRNNSNIERLLKTFKEYLE